MPFDKKGKFAYLINELSNEVNIFSYEDGNFTEIQTISTLAENFEKSVLFFLLHFHHTK